MGRVTELAVWLNGRHVAWVHSPRIGMITCAYTREVVEQYDVGTPLLSCSLPVRSGRFPATAFVVGLLPEGQHRAAMATQAGRPATDVLGLLAHFGRDIAGAVTLAPMAHPGPGPRSAPSDPARSRTAHVLPLTAQDLEEEVSRLPEHPLGLHPDSELSLAGLQDKLLLVDTGTAWGRPVNGFPSTHILKLDNAVLRGVVRAEHTCLRLAAAAGLTASASQLIAVGDAECIVVERFDRRRDGSQVVRIHQEDTCQALGLNPDRHEGRGKYQQTGGPSLRSIAELLSAWGSSPEHDLQALLDRIVFTVAIGDADVHGKNIALLHTEPGEIRLAPMYDTVPTALWPSLRADAAMSINDRYDLRTITVDDITREARSWGLGAALVADRIASLLDRLAAAITSGASSDEPRVTALVADRLTRLRNP